MKGGGCEGGVRLFPILVSNGAPGPERLSYGEDRGIVSGMSACDLTEGEMRQDLSLHGRHIYPWSLPLSLENTPSCLKSGIVFFVRVNSVALKRLRGLLYKLYTQCLANRKDIVIYLRSEMFLLTEQRGLAISRVRLSR